MTAQEQLALGAEMLVMGKVAKDLAEAIHR